MSSSFAVIVGDIGGTNARLQLFWYISTNDDSSPKIHHIFRKTYRTNTFTGLGPILERFFEDSLNTNETNVIHNDVKQKNIRIVLAVCGPIWNNGRSNETNNVRMEATGSGWPTQHAHQIEEQLGLKTYSLVFLNDFEAIGYCLAGQVDSHANELCKFTKMIVLHDGDKNKSETAKTPVACLGAGTGLGACFLSPTESGRYIVYPSEAGMTETFCPRSSEEWALLEYLRHDEPFVEIEQLVSGPGFIKMLKFYSEFFKQPLSSQLSNDLDQAIPDDIPATIVRHAQDHSDQLCLRVIEMFLDVFGRALGTAAQTFLPYRGLYITGGILPKLSWYWQRKENNALLKSYLNQGPKMSDTVARVPLILINDDDLGLKGCLYYMTTQA